MRSISSFTLALAIAAGCGDTPATAPDGGGEDAAPLPVTGVDLVRDARGVPHLYAASLEKAFFGLGYASAQDRMFQMVLRRATMRGRLAELFAAPAGSPGAGAFNARLVDSDRVVRTLGYARHAESIVGDLPGDIPALLAAYADGVNAYLASSAYVPSQAMTALEVPTPEPWTAADSLLAWDWIGYLFTSPRSALQRELDAYVCANGGPCMASPSCDLPIDEAAAVVPPHDEWPPGSGNTARVALDTPGLVDRPDVLIKASHGWVVSGERTTTGKPLLVGEPQLALEAPSTWYEAHLQTEGVDVRGVGLAGAPGMFVFWNQHVAQTLTAGGADNADLVQLAMAPTGDAYIVDGTSHAITTETETILVRHATPRTLTIRSTMFGPIVGTILDNAPPGQTFAARLVERANPQSHSIVAAIDGMRASSLATYQAAIAHWVTPGVNSLYAGVDAGALSSDPGHIAYHALLRIPDRARIQRAGVDVTGRYPIDGSLAANVWSTLLPREWSPYVVDPPAGYLFSGNHLAVGSWFDAYAYSGLAGSGDTYRSLRARKRLAELLPLGGPPVDPAVIDAMHVDDQSDVARLYSSMLDYLAARGIGEDPGDLDAEPATREERVARVRMALASLHADGGHLRTTDTRARVAAAATSQLAQLSRWQVSPSIGCRWGGAQGGVSWMLKDFETSPSTVMTSDVVDLVQRTADQAWTSLRPELPGPDPRAWSTPTEPALRTIGYQINFTCLLPSAGNSCSLTDVHTTQLALSADFSDTLNSAGGSSYPMTVDLANPEAARALLPPGVSEEPTSPFFHDGLDEIVAKAAGDAAALPAAPRVRSVVDATAVGTEHFE
ncbi:MAG: penicillin acylase family protein [Kofleriaceae bacterium]